MSRLLKSKNILINENKIGDSGARMIGEGLKVNSTLTELYLCVIYPQNVIYEIWDDSLIG